LQTSTTSIFITGTGTGIGKTVVSAIITEALHADYWKPVQAGFEYGTDSEWLQGVISNPRTKIHTETYKLKMPASPHIAAREEGVRIELDVIRKDFVKISNSSFLVIEGAGGLLSPLNDNEFVLDLIRKLRAKVILVSRNYLGSINHSLLTSSVCRQNGIEVLGWIFNDRYMNYEDEIVTWSGLPKIISVPCAEKMDSMFIAGQAQIIKQKLQEMLPPTGFQRLPI